MSTSIEELIKSLGVSVREAQYLINKFSLVKYAEYFTEEHRDSSTVVLTPRCISFPLPHTDEKIDVPIITLVNHSSLELEEVEIKMVVNTSWNPKSQQVEVDVSPMVPGNKLPEGDESSHNTTHINLKFKIGPSAEGIAKHVESYYQEFKRNNY
jgi:hypothetical protein